MSWYRESGNEPDEFRDKWIPVQSSAIDAVAYYEPLGILEFRLKGGRQHTFRGIPPERFTELMLPETSKGRFFNTLLKEQRERKKAEERLWTNYDAREFTLRIKTILESAGLRIVRISGVMRGGSLLMSELIIHLAPSRKDSDFSVLGNAFGVTVADDAYAFSVVEKGRTAVFTFG